MEREAVESRAQLRHAEAEAARAVGVEVAVKKETGGESRPARTRQCRFKSRCSEDEVDKIVIPGIWFVSVAIRPCLLDLPPSQYVA